jgi:hypothetical protein
MPSPPRPFWLRTEKSWQIQYRELKSAMQVSSSGEARESFISFAANG